MVVTTKRPHVSDFIMDAEEKRPVIIVSVPIMKDDDLIYVFSLSVDVGVFQHILDKKFQPKMTVVIADRGGTIIARSPRDNAFVGRSMPMREVSDYVDTTGRAQDLEGQPSLFARKISRIAGWSILSFVPESAANPKIIRGLRGYVAMMALVTTLGLVGAVYLGRIVVAPLHGLQRAAEALGKGKDFTFERCFLKEARAVEEALAQSAAQRKALEDQKSLLVNELSHRSRNQLSVIQSVARQTLARSPSTADAQLVLNQRLNSLARTYKTLTQTPSYNAPIGRIVSDELAAISSQSMIEGPELFLNPTAAQTLALIVHELATNAAKYGALSVAGGVVRVRWWTVACGNDMRFHFSWKESGGPTVKAPERRGFGSVLIVDIATMQLDGQVSREFRREGFRYHLGAPLVEIAARPALVQQVQNFL
jgi:two-component sensor histidine kinase